MQGAFHQSTNKAFNLSTGKARKVTRSSAPLHGVQILNISTGFQNQLTFIPNSFLDQYGVLTVSSGHRDWYQYANDIRLINHSFNVCDGIDQANGGSNYGGFVTILERIFSACNNHRYTTSLTGNNFTAGGTISTYYNINPPQFFAGQTQSISFSCSHVLESHELNNGFSGTYNALTSFGEVRGFESGLSTITTALIGNITGGTAEQQQAIRDAVDGKIISGVKMKGIFGTMYTPVGAVQLKLRNENLLGHELVLP